MEILKKAVSALLALVMIFTMLPLSALAAENENVAGAVRSLPEETAPEAETGEEKILPEIVIEEAAETVSAGGSYITAFVDKENNNSRSTANSIYVGGPYYGELTDWDTDYFKFSTTAYGSGTLQITITVDAVYGNFSVALLDDEGMTVGYDSNEVAAEHGGYQIVLSKTVARGGTFYLQIMSTGEYEPGNSYAFDISVKEGSFGCSHYNANSKVTKPTCVDQGYTTYTCIDCGKTWIMDRTEPTGVHTYTNEQDTNCNVCGAVREVKPVDPVGGSCGENVRWELKDGTLTISGTGDMYDYSWEGEDVSPWEAEAYTVTQVVIQDGVTGIGENAFRDCIGLKSVDFSDSVTIIGNGAFYRCLALTSVHMPQKVSKLGAEAFYGCTALKEITLPEEITEIGMSTFCCCSALTSVTIPEGVNTIGNAAFALCESLQSIIIPESVTSINYWAFEYCQFLTSVIFLGEPPAINEKAFVDVTADVSYPGNIESWKEHIDKNYGGNLTWIAYTDCPHPAQTVLEAVAPTCTETGLTEGQCCAACGKIYEAQQEIPALGHNEKAVVTEPTCADQGYTTYTCQTCKATRKADFTDPTGMHTYTNNQDTTCDVCGKVQDPIAVGGKCGPMATWELCDGVLTISGTGAMYDYCAENGSRAPWRKEEYTVNQVIIEKGVTRIGDEAFRLCTSLTDITIPEGVTSIGEYAFDSCISLTSVTVPESITEIGSYAFRSCESLTEATIHAGMTNIPNGLFQGCKALSSITIPEGVTGIGSGAFADCKALASIELPESVISIGGEAFSHCGSLQSITIPESVTSIGYNAFIVCSSLREITLPQGLTELPSDVFFGCSSLKEITIPAGVTRIGDQAFGKCSSLESIIFKGDAPEFLKWYEESEVFYMITADVHYPADNPTWTEAVRRNYGGSITWVPDESAHVHSYTETGTKPTCTEDGYTTYTCECGDSYVSDYVAAGHTLSPWKSDAQQHWLECTVCAEKLDTGSHDGNPCGVCAYEAESTHDYQLGDVNHDTKINAKDATLILQSSVGVLKETAKFCEACAEVSGDGKLNAKDSTLILQYSVNLQDTFPAGS